MSQSQSHTCSRTRLVQNAVAAVDLCSCGVLQLHMSSLTVRFTPDALSALHGALGEALTQYAVRDACGGRVIPLPLGSRPGRGEA